MGSGTICCVLLSVYGWLLCLNVEIIQAKPEWLVTNPNQENHEKFLIRVAPGKIQVNVWKVEDNESTIVYPTNTSNTFESNLCYIVQAVRRGPPLPCTYYWIGKSATEIKVQNAAYHAVYLESELRQNTRICREVEGQETSDFLKVLGYEKIDPPEQSDPNAVRMFLLRRKENDELNLYEVPLSLSFSQSGDHCLVLAEIEKVYVYCRGSTTERQENGAEELAKIMQDRKGLDEEDIIMVDGPGRNLRLFLAELQRFRNPKLGQELEKEILPRSNEFRPAELRRILTQVNMIESEENLEYFRIEIFKIFSPGPRMQPIYHDNRYMTLERLETDKCYLIDSHSNVGLFLWFGENSSIELREYSAMAAEVYLRETYDYGAPITYIHLKDVPSTVWTVQDMVRKLEPSPHDKDSAVVSKWLEGQNYNDEWPKPNSMITDQRSPFFWTPTFGNSTLPSSFPPTWALP